MNLVKYPDLPHALPAEPDVVINGHRLTHGQSMTLRVAIGSFAVI